MTRTQIQCFLTVAQERSFSRAANVLYISQPAISKSVSALERELGFPLFMRHSNTLDLTQAGGLIYDFFVRCEDEYRLLLERIEQIRGTARAPLRIGCPDTWNPAFFLETLSRHFSDLELAIECYKLSDLMIRLGSGRLDIVLTHDFYSPSQHGISSVPLTSTGCGILYSKAHFPRVESVAAFRDSCFMLYDNDIQKKFEGVIRSICAGAFTPTVKNAGQISSALFSLACGKGVMLFSDWDSVISNSAYGYFRMDKRLSVKIVYAPERSGKAVARFVREAPSLFPD